MTTENPRRLATDEAVDRAAQALEARNVRVIVVDNRNSALRELKELIPQGSQVLAVSSETLDEVGFTQYVAEEARTRAWAPCFKQRLP